MPIALYKQQVITVLISEEEYIWV